ncbi:hypothetical protein Pam2_41 [Pseudanabaena phage Pam2]|nr:hypothetical protein Pam2_41 [Pseudanabaena phage Pam2]
MQHFTHFRSFEADFGYVKQANKQLKRLNELKNNSLGTVAESVASSDLKNVNLGEAKRKINQNLTTSRRTSKKRDFYTENPDIQDKDVFFDYEDTFPYITRGENRRQMRIETGLPPVSRKLKNSEDTSSRYDFIQPSKELQVKKLNRHDFTDIRRTKDTAASPTGYLGYRKDPYKGYGGMMEEPVDMSYSTLKFPTPRLPY